VQSWTCRVTLNPKRAQTWDNTSHQIDHIVWGRDRLFVIETKTWHGVIEGRAGDETWTLRRPRGRAAITAYNPLFQNRRHAEVIGAMSGVPVTPLVVSAGFVRVPQAFSDQVIPLASLPARLGPVGPSSRRVEEAFLELSRQKEASGQGRLSARHRRRMAQGHRFDPVRALWVASVISLACALLAVEQLATHQQSLATQRYITSFL
jgi:Nuclease-related domain